MREHFERPLRDGTGLLLPGCSVRVLEPGTLDVISQTLYKTRDPADLTAWGNPDVFSSGVVDFYLDQPQVVRLGVSRPGAVDEVYFEDIEVGDREIYKETFTFTLAGVVGVGVGALRFYLDDASEIVRVRASVGSPPVGSDLIVDLNINGTSAFALDQADRPQVPAGSYTDTFDFPSPIQVAEGDYLTLDVDQVGSGNPGTNLVVQVRVRRL